MLPINRQLNPLYGNAFFSEHLPKATCLSVTPPSSRLAIPQKARYPYPLLHSNSNKIQSPISPSPHSPFKNLTSSISTLPLLIRPSKYPTSLFPVPSLKPSLNSLPPPPLTHPLKKNPTSSFSAIPASHSLKKIQPLQFPHLPLPIRRSKIQPPYFSSH
jgi:hypothetical protein